MRDDLLEVEDESIMGEVNRMTGRSRGRDAGYGWHSRQALIWVIRAR